MKAVVCSGYGTAESVEVADIPESALKADSVLIRVIAASVNRSDWEGVVGKPAYARSGPGGFRGRRRVLGIEVAGRIEAVGSGVTRFRVGDEVFGDLMYHGDGTFSEFAVAPETSPLALKPAALSFEQAAALPQSGVIALQSLRKTGRSEAR